MILDRLTNSSIYEGIHPRMAKAFEYLRNTNLKALEVGKFEIDGSNIFKARCNLTIHFIY